MDKKEDTTEEIKQDKQEQPKDITLSEILKLCMYSKDVREEMIKHPKSALKKFGFKIPKNMDIRSHVNTRTKLHLVIPPLYERKDLENFNNEVEKTMKQEKNKDA